MIKLATFINDNQIYLDKKIKETYENWGYSLDNMKRLDEWVKGSASITSLFGTKTFVLLDLMDSNKLTKFKNLIANDKKRQMFENNWFGDGVIIITKDNRGTWLQKFTEEFNGYFEKKIDKNKAKNDLLKELKLPKHLEDIVSSFVGEDYQDLILIKKSLNNIDTKNLTEAELYTYLPFKKGSVPPWDCLNAIMNLNDKNAILEYRRTTENTYPLVILSLIKTKLRNLLVYKSLIGLRKSENDIIKILNVKNSYALTDYKKNKSSLNNISKAITYLLDIEDEVKGGGDIYDLEFKMEEFILNIIRILKGE